VKDDLPEPRSQPTLAGIVTSCHDEYLSSFRALRISGFLLGRPTRRWRRTRCRLSSCVLEHGVDGAPWAANGSAAEGVVTFAFAGSPDARLRADGRDLSHDAVCLWPAGARVSMVALRPADLFFVSVAEMELGALAASAGGSPPRVAAGASLFVGEAQVARVRALALRLLEEAGTARPTALSHAVSESLEQALLGGLVNLASGPEAGRRSGTSRIDRRSVLEKVEELLEARSSEPVYVADLCGATGLAERTLRFILVEQYGMSPIRLLRCRRLCQLRRRLREDGGGNENLSRIAERHGFRHMGMLASDYRSLFGELPSETRRATGDIEEAAYRRVGPTLRDGIGVAPAPAVAAAAGAAGR
jgi:AraC-like DNA-binding protein